MVWFNAILPKNKFLGVATLQHIRDTGKDQVRRFRLTTSNHPESESLRTDHPRPPHLESLDLTR